MQGGRLGNSLLFESDDWRNIAIVKVSVLTPSGNSGDLGCTSGGTSSALTLTVN